MKKVLVFADFKQYGGAHTHFINLIDFLIGNNLLVDVILPSQCSITDDVRLSLSQRCNKLTYWPGFLYRISESPDHFVNRSKLVVLLRFFYLLDIRLKNSYDKVILSIISPGSFLSAGLLWRNCYYILHTYPHGIRSKSALSLLIKKIKSFVICYLLDRGLKIVTVSRFAVQELRSSWLEGQSHQSTYYVHNCVRIDENQNQPQTRTPRGMVVGTLGHLEWYKNPQLWLEVAQKVFKLVPEATFVWGGDGSLFKECQAAIPENLKDKIKFVGRVDNTTFFFNNVSVYFQPSVLESHGLSVVEAMFHSLPCVVSKQGGLPESVLHNVSGFTMGLDDVDGMSEAIVRLLYDSRLREEFGKNGLDRANLLFSEATWRRKMADIFEI